jgi:hypothetical protein
MYRAKLIPKLVVFECVISAALMFVLLRTHQQPKSYHSNVLSHYKTFVCTKHCFVRNAFDIFSLSSGKIPILGMKNITKSANLFATECEKFLVARVCLTWSCYTLCFCRLLHNWKLVPKVIMDSNFIELYNVIILNDYIIKLTCSRAVLCFFILWVICG